MGLSDLKTRTLAPLESGRSAGLCDSWLLDLQTSNSGPHIFTLPTPPSPSRKGVGTFSLRLNLFLC